MRKASIIPLFLAFVFSVAAFSQDADTLRVMTYNLTYYGTNTSFCTSTNNAVADKDGYLKTVFAQAQPHLLVVNEMAASSVYTNRLLSKTLNVNGTSRYAVCAIQNNGSSDLVNGVFYDKTKLSLAAQRKLTTEIGGQSLVRAIDVNTFYYLDQHLHPDSDTIFIHLVAAHLKAGSTSADENERADAAESLMAFLADEVEPGRVILCGDLNMKASSEAAYQALTAAGAYQFNDPVNLSGNWNNGAAFTAVHTQSTRTDDTNDGCYSGGGLDDRFDLILIGDSLWSGPVHYVAGSYKVIGQDGNHLNESVAEVPNNSAPSAVIGALYGASDHLPVVADFAFRRLKPTPSDTSTQVGEYSAIPASLQIKNGHLLVDAMSLTDVRIYNSVGQVCLSRVGTGTMVTDLKGLVPGVYVVVAYSAGAQPRWLRIAVP